MYRRRCARQHAYTAGVGEVGLEFAREPAGELQRLKAAVIKTANLQKSASLPGHKKTIPKNQGAKKRAANWTPARPFWEKEAEPQKGLKAGNGEAGERPGQP